MCKLLEDNFHRLGILRGKVKGVSNNIFLVINLPPDFGVLSVDLESAPGADRRVVARRIGQQRAIWVYIKLVFSASSFSGGKTSNYVPSAAHGLLVYNLALPVEQPKMLMHVDVGNLSLSGQIN